MWHCVESCARETGQACLVFGGFPFTPRALLWFAVFSVLGFVLSIAATSFVLVRLPADYFSRDRRTLEAAGRLTVGRVLALLAKNLAGWVLIALGIVLSVPGVPGQGLLTILLGVMLADFPGKYRLERAIVRRGPIRKTVNALRKRFGRPPFEFPDEGGPPPRES